MILYRCFIPATLFMLLTNSPSLAQSQQDAHVHGTAHLLVVSEGTKLEIEFHSPAMNLLGFEHQARNAAQEAVATNIRRTLTDADGLFQFEPGTCQMTDQMVDISAVLAAPSHDSSANSGANSGDEHGDHREENIHNNIEAYYHYRCEQAGELHSMSSLLFDEFPGLQSLQVQWIVGGRQGAITLDNDQRSIIFR